MGDDTSRQASTTQAIRIQVAENTPMSAQLLADALGRFERLQVVCFVSSSHALLREVTTTHPHVAVISTSLDNEPLKGLAASAQLCGSYPEIKNIMLLDCSQRDLVVGAFRAGAKAVFCRDEPIEVLYRCIQSVYAGQIWANSIQLGFVLEALHRAPALRLVNHKGYELLSRREQAVVRCVAEGLTNRETATQLKLSEHTVKNYLFRIFDKLGVSSRVELILYAFRQPAPTQTRTMTRRQDADAAAGGAPAFTASLDYLTLGEQNLAAALTLGRMYLDGEGMFKDEVAAYMWFLLGEKVYEGSRAAKTQLSARMKTDQIAEAQRRAAEWLERHCPSPKLHLDSS